MNKRNALALLAGITLAGSAAAADAAQPARATRDAAAAAIKKNPDAALAKQPKTMAQADLTQARTQRGVGHAVRVPTELWSTVGVRTDAHGQLQLTEHEGDAPATTTEGLPNE
jgi:hypothetical protein